MVLRHLRYFLAVGNFGSVSRAAVELRVAQPALSRQLHQLEADVGVELLERDHRGVRLTAAGQRLHAATQTLLARLHDAIEHAYQAHEGTLGVLRVGITREVLGADWVGDAIAGFRTAYPMVKIVATELDPSAELPSLWKGLVDVSVAMGGNGDPRFAEHTLFHDCLDLAVIPDGHPLARRDELTIADLRNEILCVPRTFLSRNPSCSRLLQESSLPWKECDSDATAYADMLAGEGWMLASPSIREHSSATARLIPVRDFQLRAPVNIRWRAHAEHSVVSRFVSFVAGEGVATPMHPTTRPTRVANLANLETSQLRALVATLEEGSLSAAAQRLGLTQPAISRHIANLRAELGIDLLRRGQSGIRPTAAGTTLEREFRKFLRDGETAIMEARFAACGVLGRCAIGTIAMELTNGFLGSAIRRAKAQQPPIEIVMAHAGAVEHLLKHELDVLVASLYPGAADHPAIASVIVRDDPLECALVATTHPLAGRTWLTRDDIAGFPFLFVSRELAPGAFDHIARALSSFGIVPSESVELNSAKLLWQMVASTDAWAIVPRSLQPHPPPRTVAIPVEGLSIPWGLGLLWRRDESDPAVKNVIAAIRA